MEEVISQSCSTVSVETDIITLPNTLFIRHLEDQDNLRYQNRNPPLQEPDDRVLTHVRTVAAEVCAKAAMLQRGSICLITSPKLRAMDTTHLVERYITLPIKLKFDGRIRELGQGEFILPHDYSPGDFFHPLQDAWNIYFKEALVNGNMLYRYGDPIQSINGARYSELIGHFTAFGENQAEFSLRFYSFLIDLSQQFSKNPETLFAIITHHTIIVRTVEVLLALRKMDLGQIAIPEGQLVQAEFAQYAEASVLTEAFKHHGGYGIIELAYSLRKHYQVLERERNYLRALVNKEEN